MKTLIKWFLSVFCYHVWADTNYFNNPRDSKNKKQLKCLKCGWIKNIGILILFLLVSCNNDKQPFSGIVVAKSYSPQHMSNHNVTPIEYNIGGLMFTSSYHGSSFHSYSHPTFHPPVVSHPSSPHKVKEEWTMWVANKEKVLIYKCPVDTFYKYHVGDHINITKFFD